MEAIARGEQVVLRSVADTDADALLTVLGDPQVMAYSTTGAATIDDCRAFVATNRDEVERTGMGAWAICTPDDPTLLGYCRLRRDVDWTEAGELELGYRLATRAWGRGHATAAATLALELAFTHHRAEAVIAVIDPGNEPSVAVAERLGMTATRELMLPEYDHPDIVYRLSATEWRALTP